MIVIGHAGVLSKDSERKLAASRPLQPPLGDLGLQRVVAGPGVAVPQLGEIEPNDVEPLGLLVRPVPGLVLGRGAFVRDDRDLTLRASYVLLGAGIEQDGKLPHHDLVADLELRLAGLPGKHLRIALADRVHVVPVAFDLGRVAFELGLGLQRLSLQAAGIPGLHLSHAFGQLAQADVVFLDQDARDGQQPPPVVGQSEIDGAAQVDVAHPAPFLRQPDSAPPEHLTHDIGVLFPYLVLLVLEFQGGVGLATDVVRRLGVGGESVVVNEFGRGRVRKFRVGGLETGHQVQLLLPGPKESP